MSDEPNSNFDDCQNYCITLIEFEWLVPSPFIDSCWRTETVIGIAKAIEETGDFSRLPILADALQDAGCESKVILNHCRVCQEHVTDCWVVKLLLDNERFDAESKARLEESKEPVLVDMQLVPVFRTPGDRFDSCLRVAFYLIIASGIASLLANAIRDHFRFAPR